MTTVIETLSDAVSRYADEKNEVNVHLEENASGLTRLEIEWSVAGQMALSGQTTDLDVGNYYIKIPNKDVDQANNHQLQKVTIPKGAIVKKFDVFCRESKAGSGTIKPVVISSTASGTDTLTAVATSGTYTDDLSNLSNVLTTGAIEADCYIYVEIASNVVTAGAFRLVVEWERTY